MYFPTCTDLSNITALKDAPCQMFLHGSCGIGATCPIKHGQAIMKARATNAGNGSGKVEVDQGKVAKREGVDDEGKGKGKMDISKGGGKRDNPNGTTSYTPCMYWSRSGRCVKDRGRIHDGQKEAHAN